MPLRSSPPVIVIVIVIDSRESVIETNLIPVSASTSAIAIVCVPGTLRSIL